MLNAAMSSIKYVNQLKQLRTANQMEYMQYMHMKHSIQKNDVIYTQYNVVSTCLPSNKCMHLNFFNNDAECLNTIISNYGFYKAIHTVIKHFYCYVVKSQPPTHSSQLEGGHLVVYRVTYDVIKIILMSHDKKFVKFLFSRIFY